LKFLEINPLLYSLETWVGIPPKKL
jgi:hypothetical protein